MGVAPDVTARLHEELDVVLRIETMESLDTLYSRFQEGRRPADTVLLGMEIEEPVRIAKRIHTYDKYIPILILSLPARCAQLKRTLMFSPFLGNDVIPWATSEIDELSSAIRHSVSRRQQRTRYLNTISSAQIRLETLPLLQPEATHYLDQLLDAFEFDAMKDGKTTKVRVDERTGVTYDEFSKAYKNGDVIDIVGISSIFKDVYQLKPLSFDHFVKADSDGPVIHDLDQLSFYQTEAYEQYVTVTDEGSGVESVLITLDGKEISNPIKIEPFSLQVGNHTIVVRAIDKLGNESIKEFTLTVVMDLDHLDEWISYGYDKGYITNKGIYNSLMAKVEGIQKAKNENARQGKINALSNEIQAQKGKKIDSKFASDLLDLIDTL